MKTATLTLNGKTYEVQLTDEQITEIEKPKKVTGFGRAEEGEDYFNIDATGTICTGTIYSRNKYFEGLYNNANYYTDESLAEWCNRNDALNRKIRRWAAEHNTEPIDWNKRNAKYYIYYNYEESRVGVYNTHYCAHPGEIFFFDYVIAKAAVEKFGDEIKWLAENRPKWF